MTDLDDLDNVVVRRTFYSHYDNFIFPTGPNILVAMHEKKK